MSISAKIALSALVVSLLIIALAALAIMYRPTATPPATPSPTASPSPTTTPQTPADANPFGAEVLNPFEDEAYNNPFAEDTEEEYVNPFSNL